MKKKILAILLTLTIGFTMVTGCSGVASKGDSDGDKAKVEAESTDDVTTKEDAVKDTDADAAEPNDRESERISYMYDHAGVTEEDAEALYKSISKSISENYLEIHDIDPSEFSIPEDIDFSYLSLLSSEYSSTDISIDEIFKTMKNDAYVSTYQFETNTMEILNAIFIGTVDWYNENTSAVRSEFYESMQSIFSLLELLPLNEEYLTFDE